MITWHKMPTWAGFRAQLRPEVADALSRLDRMSVWDHIKFLTPNTETVDSQDAKSTAYASVTRNQYDPVLVRIRGADVAGGEDGVRG